MSPDGTHVKCALAGFGLGMLALLSACSTDEARADANPAAPPVETETTSSSPEPRMPCETQPGQPAFLQPPEPSTAELLRLTAELYKCAESVVILDRDALDLYGQATETALMRDVPLLVVEQGTPQAEMTTLAEEVARLDPAEIFLFGEVSSEILAGLARVVDVRSFPSLGTADFDPAETHRLVRSSDPKGPTFLVNIDEASESMITLPVLTLGEYGIRIIDPTDSDDIERLRDQARTGVEYIVPDEWEPTDRWRIDLALAGTELPGGGTQMFPGRRLVALYGSPVTYRLGALGEQSPEQTLERLAPIVESYETDEHPIVIPSFELIATVATGSAGDDGNYSQELDPERMQPWIDVATDNDVFVVIDLQPGRADFLTQAKLYEEFLRLPNVGLALDPEWRLGPSERPLQRIGSVGAAEVN